VAGIPKVNVSANMDAIKAQIDSLAASLDVTNRMIEQQQAKLAGLKEAYANTFNDVRKNALEEQILRTEARINKLMAASDAAGFKLADLDAQFAALSNSAKVASTNIASTNNRISETGRKATTAGSNISKSMNNAGRSMMSFGRIVRMMVLWMVAFNVIMKSLTSFTTFLGSALMTNSAFANSLAQVRANLEIAFMPIYQAILPALISLMQTLARATTYIAAFISALFGTTYQASAVAAKGLNSSIDAMAEAEKQAKKTGSAVAGIGDAAKGGLAAFDEINQLSEKKDSAAAAPGDLALNLPIVAPPIDVSPTTEAMQKIQDAANKTKQVLEWLLPVIAGVGAAFLTLSVIQGVTKWISGVAAALKMLGSAGPIALVIVALAALVAAFIVLYKTNEDFRNKVNDIWQSIKNFLTPVLEVLKKILLDVWNNALVPLGKVLKDIWQTVIEPLSAVLIDVFATAFKFVADIAKDFWQNVMVPLGGFLKDIFMKVIESVIEIWTAWKPGIQIVIDAIENLWKNILKPFYEFIGGIFKDAFHQTFIMIGNVIGDLKTIFRGLIDFITGVLTGNWQKALNGLKEINDGIWKSIADTVKGTINVIIAGVNGLIRGLNKIQIKIPDWQWIPEDVRGATFGIDIPPITPLANGGIVRQPTLAMVGENNRKEAVLPLENSSAMQELGATIVNGLLAAMRFNNTGNNQSNNKPMEPIFQVDGTTFARMMMPYFDKENSRIGNKVIIQTT
jgi:phage-related protein